LRASIEAKKILGVCKAWLILLLGRRHEEGRGVHGWIGVDECSRSGQYGRTQAAPKIRNGWGVYLKEIDRIPSNPDSLLWIAERSVQHPRGVLIGMARAENPKIA
jgi:hypothetical protein